MVHLPAVDVLTQYAPAFHGIYRAIISVPFAWTIEEWCSLAQHLNPPFASGLVERLNHLFVDALSDLQEDLGKVRFVQTLISRYVSRGRPLSGYFVLCCVFEAQWTVLAQALSHTPVTSEFTSTGGEAAAANLAWQKLLHQGVSKTSQIGTEAADVLRATMKSAVKTFTAILTQIEEMDADPSEDSYAWETMSESLVRIAVILSVHA